MHVDVTLKGSLADHLPGGRADVDVAERAPVHAVLAALGLPPVHCVYVVNGHAVRKDAALTDGDRVVVYPPQAGG